MHGNILRGDMADQRNRSVARPVGRSQRELRRDHEVLADGLHLGPVGGRIVAEVFVGLLRNDPGSWLTTRPDWQPTLPGNNGTFGMTDFLIFAGVDPASRGQ